MITKMFSVYDAKAESYVTPFFQPTIGLAERVFTDEANRQDSQLAQHPEDFTLFLIGEFDQDTATLKTETAPKPLLSGLDAQKINA